MVAMICRSLKNCVPNPVTVRSKARVCCCSLAGIAGSNPAKVTDVLSLVSVMCCQVEVPASGCSLVQRIPTKCSASECVHEAAIMRRLWPTRGCCAIGGKEEKRFI